MVRADRCCKNILIFADHHFVGFRPDLTDKYRYVLGPWGGYSIAFLIVAALVPLICTRRYNRVLYTIIAILSAAFVDLFGSIWMMVVSDIALVPALVAGFLPFIVLDVVKAVIAAQIVPQIRKIVR